VETEVYQYIMNTQKSGFAVLMEMLQFKGCWLARKRLYLFEGLKLSWLWVGEAFYGQT
jgi:hypothetical protein